MATTDSGVFAIALFVPDATVKKLKENGTAQRLIASPVPDLDFLPPPWWENSHTVRLGLIQADAAAGDEKGRATDSFACQSTV